MSTYAAILVLQIQLLFSAADIGCDGGIIACSAVVGSSGDRLQISIVSTNTLCIMNHSIRT